MITTEQKGEMLVLRVDNPNLWTYKALGNKYGVSCERIRQILMQITPSADILKREYIAPTRLCEFCNVEFKPKLRSVRFCSKTCVNGARRIASLTRTEKHCMGCDTTKPVSDFYRIKSKVEGIRRPSAWCKLCHGVWVRAWRKKNPEKAKDVQARATEKYVDAHRYEINARHRYRYANDPVYRARLKAYEFGRKEKKYAQRKLRMLDPEYRAMVCAKQREYYLRKKHERRQNS